MFIGRTDAEAEAPIRLWPPDTKSYSLEKTLVLGKIKGKRRKEQQRMRWLDSITNLVDMNLNKLQEVGKTEETGVLQSMRSQRIRHDLATEQQQQS